MSPYISWYYAEVVTTETKELQNKHPTNKDFTSEQKSSRAKMKFIQVRDRRCCCFLRVLLR